VNEYRTAAGGLIDRTRALRFSFDGRELQGFAGDTLASALLANGVHLVGRSFKYHRPRGILSAGAEEPNALVTVRRDALRHTPNLRATQVELYQGLDAISQNRWPSLAFDVGGVNGALSPFIGAGFYYKTFMWPRRAWTKLYEPRIRAAAGLGRAPRGPDPDRYANRYAHCDLLVIGGGAAGLSAALTAAVSGARVMLCDEQPELGGELLSDGASRIGGENAAAWARHMAQILAGRANVTLLRRTTAFGYFSHNFVALCERLQDHLSAPAADRPRERLWQVRAREVIFACGALERPLVFPGNDRPGILLAGAAGSYLNRYGVMPGRRVVIITAHDAPYQTALDLAAAGVELVAIADVRATVDGALPNAARAAGIAVHEHVTVTATAGRARVQEMSLARRAAGGSVPRAAALKLSCDAVLMSAGYTPSVHLHSQSRGRVQWDPVRQAFVPGEGFERVRSAGGCRGHGALADSLNDGAAAAQAALKAIGYPSATIPKRQVEAVATGPSGWIGALPQADASGDAAAWVDWQNDVTVKDLKLALQEGFTSIEHIKRYTTTGMATDQGKTSSLHALGIVAQALGKSIPEVGLTTFRMPYTPVTFGALAGYARGELFDPVRNTPSHEWALEHDAVFEDVGLWRRARYFPHPGEDMHQAVARECLNVRASCGMLDASTLGKIEVVGPDAATFLDRLYVNSWSKLAPGRTRYGLLLREDGFIIDDGVVARLAHDRFHVTTTTGGAARVLAIMEDYLQTEWRELVVWLTSTTEQWAVVAVQGPQARAVLQQLIDAELMTGVAIDAATMPHMAVLEGRFCGAPMRLFRVSFTGELGFEINVPSDRGLELWETLLDAGKPFGISPYGTESMHVLRAEKGYIIVGQDTDGTVTPDDAGLGWTIGKLKPDFVGKRSLERATMSAPERKQLVGLATPGDPRLVLEEGSQIMTEATSAAIVAATAAASSRPIGHVSSSYYSAALGKSIALALVRGGRARLGETLYVPMPNEVIPVQVTSAVFYDPTGARINA
jgi:sarcosine oxidase, subunit alpha